MPNIFLRAALFFIYKNNNQSMLERFYAELGGVNLFQYVMQGKTYLLFANKNYRSTFFL